MGELEKAYQTALEARRTAEAELQRLQRMLEEKERIMPKSTETD
jgi:hypothetical protein